MDDDHVGEQQLVDAARAGDLAAFEALARCHQTLAFRAAWLVTRDAAEAEDALQEAFLKAHAALPSFRPGAPFRPWLLRIVTNEALNRRRAAGHRADLVLRVGALVTPAAHDLSPEAAMLAQEQRAFLIARLNELDDRDRIVLAYRYLLDLSVAELAVALDCPASTVRTRISRALSRLRERMTHAPAEPTPASEPRHD